jgi:hypothetical protein
MASRPSRQNAKRNYERQAIYGSLVRAKQLLRIRAVYGLKQTNRQLKMLPFPTSTSPLDPDLTYHTRPPFHPCAGGAAAGAPGAPSRPWPPTFCIRRFLVTTVRLCRPTTLATGMRMRNLHHKPAHHGDGKHEEPVGDEREHPGDVPGRDKHSVLGHGPVEGVPPSLNQGQGLLGARGLELEEFSGRDGRQVQPLAVDVNGSRRGQHLEDPETPRPAVDGVAQNGLLFAVYVAHVGRSGDACEPLGRLVEGRFSPSAEACFPR